jgi:hypothetical protein
MKKQLKQSIKKQRRWGLATRCDYTSRRKNKNKK